MNKEIKLILENQSAIMNSLFSHFYGNKKGKLTIKLLMNQMGKTAQILIPKPKKPTIPEQTKDALCEVSE